MLVFDKTSPESFDRVGYWTEEVSRYGHASTLKTLIGNKCDLGGQVSSAEAEAKDRSFGIEYIETSAKMSAQVDSAFTSLARQLVQKRKEAGAAPAARTANLLSRQDNQNKSQGCC